MKNILWVAGASGVFIAAVAACGGSGGGVYDDLDGGGLATDAAPGDGALPPGVGVGAACGATVACRSGLECTSEGTCKPCGCTATGAACTLNDDCNSGSYCGPARTCTPGGGTPVGGTCASDGQCDRGLRCGLVGFSAQCQPEGHADVGASCVSNGDCLGGLGCVSAVVPGDASATSADAATARACQPYPPSGAGLSPLAIPTWTGETCRDDAGPTQAYFRVPRGTGDADFYRLPFPNDVRRTGGKLDLTGHPTPGPELLGYDVVQRWLTDLSTTADGFSAYPTVFFRFSAPIDQSVSLKGKDAIRYLDITQPASPSAVGFAWSATTDRNAYICNNWLGVRPPIGQPLTPGHTYAVVVSTDVRDASSKPIAVSPDLTALLGASAPGDAVLAAQWPKYQALRDWAAGAGVATSSILDATVFTVAHADAIGPRLAASVAAAPAPTATGWIRCGDAPSPCPQATGDRACGTASSVFDELHALVTLPIFQQGTAPYAAPADGGDFVYGSDGTPQVQRTEAVCLSLTVPKTTMPADGWPLIVYAHGTGGSFRSAVTEGVAARAASIDAGGGARYHVAVLGIDQVEHGPRRGASTDSPDNLFYNFSNPAAARGNPLQGAADQMALVRFASALDLAAGQSPTGAPIKIGPIAFWGHSQGATEGAIAMPYTPGVLGAVLSGEGASLIDGLLGKKNPVDIADVLPVVLEDTPAHVTAYHPVLALLQNALDRVDPLNHAGALVANPVSAATQKHVFQPFGLGDTYAPPTTEQTFALAAHLDEAQPPAGVTAPALAGPTLPVPVTGNRIALSVAVTAVVRQYNPPTTPDGRVVADGHFVALQSPDAETDTDRFLGDALAGKVPAFGR